MADISCIYEMNMLEENRQMEQDILSGRGMEVLLCLMNHAETGMEVARTLGMPVYSVQLYLQRLVNAKLVREEDCMIRQGECEKRYYLVADDIELINNLRMAKFSDAEQKCQTDISAQHFAMMTRNAIKNANWNRDKPNKVKAYFMNAKKKDMEQFKKEIEELFLKYQNLEDADAKDVYSLFTVLAPYDLKG